MKKDARNGMKWRGIGAVSITKRKTMNEYGFQIIVEFFVWLQKAKAAALTKSGAASGYYLGSVKIVTSDVVNATIC